ncbi:astacin-like metalloprotease toxin 5 [Centruroides sculpturatus]|uniref:astacin-like metalloprotease toxin 5 n=1 Tax=Centruroides sculpturatus TaxID=218467 RepID=UPI000C6E8067|nr:astacin-like metalloprotease toxin 5 [Centruroides sculpturatus]
MLFLFALFTVTFARHVDLPYIALHNPDLFQGDIIGIEDNDVRNAIPIASRRWPGGKVAFVLDSTMGDKKSLISQAMNHINQQTGGCISFNERQFETDFIRFINADGCYSNIGRVGGSQPLSLGKGCEYVGTIVHEILHALGFYHEQNRSDRDDHLTIYWQNIKKGMEDQFALLQPSQNTIYDKFNTESIMIYGNYAFSKDGVSKTMVAKSGARLREPYEKSGLTNSDVYRIKKLYGCA